MPSPPDWVCDRHGPVVSKDGGRAICDLCEAEDQRTRGAAIEAARARAEVDATRSGPPIGMSVAAAFKWLIVGWPRWTFGLGMLCWIVSVVAIATGHGALLAADDFTERLRIGLAGGALFPLFGGVIYLLWKLFWGLLGVRADSREGADLHRSEARADAAFDAREEYGRVHELTQIEQSRVLGTGSKLIALAALYAFFSISAFVMTFFGKSAPTSGGSAGVTIGATGGDPTHTFAWLTDAAAAKKDAAREGRPMIIDFTAEWCAACKELQATTFPSPRFTTAASRFVGLRIDGTDQDNATFDAYSKTYGVQGLPAIVLLDSKGKQAKIFKKKPSLDELVAALDSVH